MTKAMKYIILFLTVSLAFAGADTYRVQLFQPSSIDGKVLKPGEYKLTLENDKVMIQKGKESVEATVKVESSDTKYPSTSVRYTDENGQMKIREIRLGGTGTRVVFN